MRFTMQHALEITLLSQNLGNLKRLRAQREARSEVLSQIKDKAEYKRPGSTRPDSVTLLTSLYPCNHGFD